MYVHVISMSCSSTVLPLRVTAMNISLVLIPYESVATCQLSAVAVSTLSWNVFVCVCVSIYVKWK